MELGDKNKNSASTFLLKKGERKKKPDRVRSLASPGSERSQGCLLQLEPPSHKQVHSWRAQLCYKSLISMLAKRLPAGSPALCRRQEAEQEAESGMQGLPGKGGLRPSPLGCGDGRTPTSLHGISWHGTPHQPDCGESQVCLHRNKCSAIDGQRCVGTGLWPYALHCQGIFQMMFRNRGW